MTAAADQTDLVIRDAEPADHNAIRDLTLGVYVGEGYAGPHYAATLADVAGRAGRMPSWPARMRRSSGCW